MVLLDSPDRKEDDMEISENLRRRWAVGEWLFFFFLPSLSGWRWVLLFVDDNDEGDVGGMVEGRVRRSSDCVPSEGRALMFLNKDMGLILS